MAWQPLRKPKQITAKQSTDFPHNSVYSPRNHVDTYFSNMSGTGSHKWVWKQTRALKYDVDLQRLHHKRGKLTQASCVSAKSDGSLRGVKKKNVWVEETLRNRRNDVCGFLVHKKLLTKNKDVIVDRKLLSDSRVCLSAGFLQRQKKHKFLVQMLQINR